MKEYNVTKKELVSFLKKEGYIVSIYTDEIDDLIKFMAGEAAYVKHRNIVSNFEEYIKDIRENKKIRFEQKLPIKITYTESDTGKTKESRRYVDINEYYNPGTYTKSFKLNDKINILSKAVENYMSNISGDIFTTYQSPLFDDLYETSSYYMKAEWYSDFKNIDIYNKKNKINIKKMKMKNINKVINIEHFFNEKIDLNKSLYGTCVLNYICKIYNGYISNKNIKSFFKNSENGIDINEIKDFCIKYNIYMIAYDINGNMVENN
ncbi:MAG: hypothetical protein ACRC5W_10690, partial [Cetobacterium sp.]